MRAVKKVQVVTEPRDLGAGWPVGGSRLWDGATS